jgi:uncharacterized protein
MNPPRIVIAGGSGHLGRMLVRHFHQSGGDITVLSRFPAPTPWKTVHWNGRDLNAWTEELEAADVLINLAGRSVNCRYTPGNRRQILDSRVDSTRALARAVAQSARPPRLWMNASTATIYRHSLDRDMDEQTGELGGSESGVPETWRFSTDVATAWEQAFFETALPNTRRIALRAAMVMSPDPGGAFDLLLSLVRRGFGGSAASGAQFVSWIHDLDFVRAVEFLIARPDLDGPINICAPHPLPNRDFMRALREASGALVGLPASRWMLEVGAVFLRTETELILKSRRAVPRRLLESGFEFLFPSWPEAAQDLVRRRSDSAPDE